MSAPSGVTWQTRLGLRRVRRQVVLNLLRRTVASTKLRLTIFLVASILFWLLLFVIFYLGFSFVRQTNLASFSILEFLFRMFFSSILVMLFVSCGLLSYGGLFTSREAAYLLTTPTPTDQVFAFKFQESAFLATWALLLLATPMTIAFGWCFGAPWDFYLLAVFYFPLFALIPSVAGALAALLFSRYIPRPNRLARNLLILAATAAALWLGARIWMTIIQLDFTKAWISQLMGEWQFFDRLFLPSKWISQGLLLAGMTETSRTSRSLPNLLLLAGNAGMLYLVTAWSYGHLYRAAYDHVHCQPTPAKAAPRRRPATRIAAFLAQIIVPRSVPLRALILKDIRTFQRDPMQWSQAILFICLLLLYIITLSRLNFYANNPYWRNLVGLFNIAVTGLILSTFTSRFVFPMPSLELGKFWLLARVPVTRADILWSKLRLSVVGTLSITGMLIIIGSLALRLDWLLVAVQLFTVAALCMGLSGIAVGLGAKYHEINQPDSSRIAASLGGTLSLVFSVLFLFVVVSAMAIPCHYYAMGEVLRTDSTADLPFKLVFENEIITRTPLLFAISGLVVFLVTLLATIVPMRLGSAAFEALEL